VCDRAFETTATLPGGPKRKTRAADVPHRISVGFPSERSGTATSLVLPHEIAEALVNGRLAVSLEPSGGSTTGQPSGPVLFSGAIMAVNLGQPNLVIRIDRTKAARYGISVGDLNAVVQAAIGGQEITRVFEGEMHFALTIRLAPRYRDNVDAIRTVPVAIPNADAKSPTTPPTSIARTANGSFR
jgi:AcrB/AcrD/AcrF family